MVLGYHNNVYSWFINNGVYDISHLKDTIHYVQNNHIYYFQDDELKCLPTNRITTSHFNNIKYANVKSMFVVGEIIVFVFADRVIVKTWNNSKKYMIADAENIEILRVTGKFVYRRDDKWHNVYGLPVDTKCVWYYGGILYYLTDKVYSTNPGHTVGTIDVIFGYTIICFHPEGYYAVLHPDGSLSLLHLARPLEILDIDESKTTLLLTTAEHKYAFRRSSVEYVKGHKFSGELHPYRQPLKSALKIY